MTTHPAIAPGRTAVVTGAASGIGLAACKRFAGLGLKIVLADLEGDALREAAGEVGRFAPGGAANVRAVPTDVSRIDDLRRLKDAAFDAFGDVGVLMNNAAIGGGGKPWENYEGWRRLIDINLWGVINGMQAFLPEMIARGKVAAVVSTGSKQGITTPPGDAAYNVAKAGVKVVTEQAAHELRSIEGCRISAHLLIPGFTFTGLTAKSGAAKPADAWTADQVVDFMLEALGRNDFYILCPDNAVSRALDERRMQWAADDIIRNRPALSRWHPDFKEEFAAFVGDLD